MIEVSDQEYSFCSPLRSSIFINSGNKVHKTFGVHISKDGLLVSSEANLPENSEVDIMFPLFQYPDFSELSEDDVFQMELKRNIHLNSFRRDTIRCKGVLLRQHEEQSTKFHAFNFIGLNRETETLLENYLDQFTHNLIHLVDVITGDKSRKLLYPLSFFLGYDTGNENTLCQKIINDFERLKH